MSESRKKSRRRRSSDDIPELTSIEKSIAKYLRFQCPIKKGILMGMQVVYFNGSKAVECLIESKWSSISMKSANNGKNPICFSSKHDAVQMLRKFLDHEMFRRVIKVYKDKNLPSESIDDVSQLNTTRQRKNKSTEGSTQTIETTNDEDLKDKDKIKKKKFKFEMHDDQIFNDSINDFYVWIYSPTTIKQYLIGGLLVIGCIGVCLFPLWPTQVRTGVYYLSIILASLLAGLLSLAVIKYIIFAIVWFLTIGKIKFWLLPNLTEDVGFIESFIPLYVINMKVKEEKTKENSININENEQEDNEKKLSINVTDEEQKRQKLAEEGFEVLSKDELETK